MGILISLYSYHHLYFLVFDSRYPNGCEVTLHCSFRLNLTIANVVEHIFMCLLAIWITLFGEIPIQILGPLFKKLEHISVSPFLLLNNIILYGHTNFIYLLIS